ncbi:DNA-binding transcriptional regulator [Edwardsiella tarda]|uniref:ogr/Delta-like zinc finger family protein n=1 Tax=Edwardsiella tarda TaxID=636 RepID=UPI000DFC33B7|nr:ogr/Delta-like zinc finger family protein [Edwardsiella tarda]STE53229.1 DNA-binding transcriptional regulator [Edwardsiella tarda]
MFHCPQCGASSRKRTSRYMNEERHYQKTYYQCNNLTCGACFYSIENVIGLVGRNKKAAKEIPWEDFPASHRGRDQLPLELDKA